MNLRAYAANLVGKIAGYSSIAIGADTLFAEACLALNIPWRAILPFALADFRDDFNDDEWANATNLLGQAAKVEISESLEDRTAAYLSCGLRTVDGADLHPGGLGWQPGPRHRRNR